jgi:hypothetical protein
MYGCPPNSFGDRVSANGKHFAHPSNILNQFLGDYKMRAGISCGRCCIPTSTIVATLEFELKKKISVIKKVEVVK